MCDFFYIIFFLSKIYAWCRRPRTLLLIWSRFHFTNFSTICHWFLGGWVGGWVGCYLSPIKPTQVLLDSTGDDMVAVWPYVPFHWPFDEVHISSVYVKGNIHCHISGLFLKMDLLSSAQSFGSCLLLEKFDALLAITAWVIHYSHARFFCSKPVLQKPDVFPSWQASVISTGKPAGSQRSCTCWVTQNILCLTAYSTADLPNTRPSDCCDAAHSHFDIYRALLFQHNSKHSCGLLTTFFLSKTCLPIALRPVLKQWM